MNGLLVTGGVVFIAAMIAAAASVAPIIRFARRTGYLDIPEGRKDHPHPMPYGGGFVILVGVAIPMLVGLGIVIGLPIIGVVAVSSLVGLPLGFGVLGALGVVHATGYVAGAFFLGRCILKTPKDRFGAFFVGWAILRVLAILPLLGMLVWVAAAVYGIGTLAVAGFRAGRLPRSTDDPHAPTVPPPLSAPDAAPGAPTPAAVATAPASDVEAPPATDPGSESGSPE